MLDQAYLTSKSKKIKNVNDDLQEKDSSDSQVESYGFDSNGGDERKDWTTIKVEIDALSQKNKVDCSELLKKDKEISDYWSKARARMRAFG